MASIFTIDNTDDFAEKLNMDDLYEKKRQTNVIQLEICNKILNRIHVRIKMTSKQRCQSTLCWYVVPEIIIGVPHYDHASCIAYLIGKLKTNGFAVRYTHPNMLLISWGHYVPQYVREEIKKKTGIVYNESGEVLGENIGIDDRVNRVDTFNADKKKPNQETSVKKAFTPINAYKPSGKLIYNNDFLNRVENKLQN
jgi:hypothetical protein|tara:strand:- start:156 stop:743 length:588 start_codon:yes stop_codon:yes gene_type:complete